MTTQLLNRVRDRIPECTMEQNRLFGDCSTDNLIQYFIPAEHLLRQRLRSVPFYRHTFRFFSPGKCLRKDMDNGILCVPIIWEVGCYCPFRVHINSEFRSIPRYAVFCCADFYCFHIVVMVFATPKLPAIDPSADGIRFKLIFIRNSLITVDIGIAT